MVSNRNLIFFRDPFSGAILVLGQCKCLVGVATPISSTEWNNNGDHHLSFVKFWVWGVAQGSEIVFASSIPSPKTNRSPLKDHGKNRTKNTPSMENTKSCPIWGTETFGGQTLTSAWTKKNHSPFCTSSFNQWQRALGLMTCWPSSYANPFNLFVWTSPATCFRPFFLGITWIQKVGWGKEVAGKTRGNQQKSTHPLSHFSFEPHPKETTDIRSDSSILKSNDGAQVLAY